MTVRATTRRRIALGGIALLSVAAFGLPAIAHPELATDGGTHDHSQRDAHQHGDGPGHLPPTDPLDKTVSVVSKLKLKNAVPEKIADVGVHKGYAYLAAWGVVTCKYNGVHVVDIRNPQAPKEVSFIQSKEGSYPGEGVQALFIDTPKFTGDILVTNNEKCKDKAGFGGMNIYNITNPANPSMLAEGVGDFTVNGQGKKAANEIHSVFAWDAGDKAYAVIVDNEEGADVDIVDITDPRKAKVIAEYDLGVKFKQILQNRELPHLTEVFNHDMIVKKIGERFIMSVSYWDGGYVLLDVTNPVDPQYIGDSDFPNPDSEPLAQNNMVVFPEGNAHQSEFTTDNKFLIAADEDFSPFSIKATANGQVQRTSSGSGTPPIPKETPLEGTTFFVGRGCNGDTLPSVPAGATGVQIAVVERGSCTFTEKVANVTTIGGYEGILIFNRTGSDACDNTLSMSVDGTTPTFGVVTRSFGFALFNAGAIELNCETLLDPLPAPIALGARGAQISFASTFDGWGYVRLFKDPLSGSPDPNTKKNLLKQVDTYALPESLIEGNAFGKGDLSVHEIAVSENDARLAYISYYSGGLRVVRINEKTETLDEVGRFIDAGGSNLWGVQVFTHTDGQEYVAASDRDYGLYIFKYNPPATP